MKETKFIAQNKDKWDAFEQELEKSQKDPDKLNELYVQITDDLSYSRTFYPNRSVRVYLNGLAQKIFFSIYKNRKSQRGRLWHFWTDELPQMVYEARREFMLSFIVFGLAVLIGMLSAAMDSEFVEVILGEGYVEMTLENIRSGDPMAVYKEKGAFGMALGITMNNLFVAFLCFVMGVLAGIGSIGVLVRNGIMLGAFQYFFIERDLFQESFLTVWMHGTLEISAIIIAGAAGITMGKGLVFPGTYARLQAFQTSARRGLKIMIGITPIIIMAGVIEGYLTRYTDTPDSIRLFFILTCLAFVLLYFVWYPIQKARTGFKAPLKKSKLSPDRLQIIDFYAIKSVGAIFSDLFILYRKHLSAITLLGLAATTFYTLAVFLLARQSPSEIFYYPWGTFGTLSVVDNFFQHPQIILLPAIAILTFAIPTFGLYTIVLKEAKTSTQANFVFQLKDEGYSVLKTIFGVGALYLIVWTGVWALLLMIFTFPIVLLWIYIMYEEKLNLFHGLKRTFDLMSGVYTQAFALMFILMLIGFLFYSILDTSVAWLYFEMMGWLFNYEQAVMNDISSILLTFISVFGLQFVFAIFLLGFSLYYYSLLEMKEALSLYQKIKQFGQQQRIQGLDRE